MTLPDVILNIVREYLMISTEEVRARRGLVFAEVCHMSECIGHRFSPRALWLYYLHSADFKEYEDSGEL